jgi:hypothetical protein
MKLAQFAAIVALISAVACTGGDEGAPPSPQAGDSSVSADSGLECAAVGPYDTSGFTFRSSCVYVIASDAATLSACDEWTQGGAGDWGEFIEGCTGKNGALSANPCAAAGRVGECTYAAECHSQLFTYFYGPSGVQSFELACVASVGAAWTTAD